MLVLQPQKIVIFGQPALNDGVISWRGHSGELRHQTMEKETAWAVVRGLSKGLKAAKVDSLNRACISQKHRSSRNEWEQNTETSLFCDVSPAS